MLIGCGDCAPSTLCDWKVLSANIDAAETPTDDSYCPGQFTVSDGTPTALCSGLDSIVNWVIGQMANFQDDSLQPWNTFVTAFFTAGGGGSPYEINGPATFPGVTSSTGGGAYNLGFGAFTYGSYFACGSLDTPVSGPAGQQGACGSAQIVALRMTGDVYLTPLNLTGDITESCLLAPGNTVCSAGGGQGDGTYYIPMPPYDACVDPAPDTGIQVAYLPYEGSGGPANCLLGFSGSYTNCLSPDPFFGSDPP
jgi:hypothetical protein